LISLSDSYEKNTTGKTELAPDQVTKCMEILSYAYPLEMSDRAVLSVKAALKPQLKVLFKFVFDGTVL